MFPDFQSMGIYIITLSINSIMYLSSMLIYLSLYIYIYVDGDVSFISDGDIQQRYVMTISIIYYL